MFSQWTIQKLQNARQNCIMSANEKSLGRIEEKGQAATRRLTSGNPIREWDWVWRTDGEVGSQFGKAGEGFGVEVAPKVNRAPPIGSGTALLVVNAAPRVKVYTMLLSDKKAISVSR